MISVCYVTWWNCPIPRVTSGPLESRLQIVKFLWALSRCISWALSMEHLSVPLTPNQFLSNLSLDFVCRIVHAFDLQLCKLEGALSTLDLLVDQLFCLWKHWKYILLRYFGCFTSWADYCKVQNLASIFRKRPMLRRALVADSDVMKVTHKISSEFHVTAETNAASLELRFERIGLLN